MIRFFIADPTAVGCVRNNPCYLYSMCAMHFPTNLLTYRSSIHSALASFVFRGSKRWEARKLWGSGYLSTPSIEVWLLIPNRGFYPLFFLLFDLRFLYSVGFFKVFSQNSYDCTWFINVHWPLKSIQNFFCFHEGNTLCFFALFLLAGKKLTGKVDTLQISQENMLRFNLTFLPI